MRRIERPRAALLAAALALVGTVLTTIGAGRAGALPARLAAPVALEADPAAPPGLSELARLGVPTPGLPVPRRLAVDSPTGAAPEPRALGRAIPIRLDIPVIGVHTSLMRLGTNPDGTVEVPPLDSDAPAGWYQNSVTPGEPGAAVILGHVDSARDGPAIFYRLAALRPGDQIAIRRADGTVARFAVTDVAQYPKASFPTRMVYGRSADPVLRLVTCGGSFDRAHRVYRDNVIVSARWHI